MRKRCVVVFFMFIILFSGHFTPPSVFACGCNCDPCLLVYPTLPTTYHYNPFKYYTVSAGHPLYDPAYDRGGEVLIMHRMFYPDRIAYEVYQAPDLTGFEAATGTTGYYFTATSFDLVIDGWSNFPTTRSDIRLKFKPIPDDCTPTITLNGTPVTGPHYRILLGDLVVTTPVVTPTRTYYSDTMTLYVEWSGCIGLYMIAWEDCDHNWQQTPCADCEDETTNCCHHCNITCAHGAVIPVEEETWGAIKAMYK
jgi:hypothetical protein